MTIKKAPIASGAKRSQVERPPTDIDPKVKAPAIVGVVIACILAVLTILSTVPALALYVSIGMAIVTTAAGYLVYGD